MPDSTESTIVLRLELAPGEPIRGSLTDEAGTRVAFTGGLAFAAAVERASRSGTTTD